MNLGTTFTPKHLEFPFFAVVVGLTYVCGLLLFGQFL
jgi:hypothetical protein